MVEDVNDDFCELVVDDADLDLDCATDSAEHLSLQFDEFSSELLLDQLLPWTLRTTCSKRCLSTHK